MTVYGQRVFWTGRAVRALANADLILSFEDHPSHALNTHPSLRRNHLEPLGNRKEHVKRCGGWPYSGRTTVKPLHWDHYQNRGICGMCTISNSAGFCLSTVCCHGLQAELFGLNCTRISQESSYLASCVYFSSFGCWESAISHLQTLCCQDFFNNAWCAIGRRKES